MIAGEQKLLAIKQNHVSPRVTGDRNREQIMIEFNAFVSPKHALDPETSGAIINVHYAFAIEPLGEATMISDIIAVRQEHCADTTHRLDFSDQLGSEPRGIYQHVTAFTLLTNDQIAPGAKA